MENFINFLIQVGRLKRKKRRGWVMHQIKNSESTAEHIFRMTLLTWILGRKKKINLGRAIKMALIHDICEVYAFDETPYDPLLPRNPKERKRIKEILKKWPKFSPDQKRNKVLDKHKEEAKGLNRLIAGLPFDLKIEIRNLWIDFEKGLTSEGRFVKQVDKAENLLQGLEYWEKQGKIQRKLWGRWAKEIFDDPILLEFVENLDKRFSEKKRKKKKRDNFQKTP